MTKDELSSRRVRHGLRKLGAVGRRRPAASTCPCSGPFGRTPYDGCAGFDVGKGRHRLWGTAVFSHGGIGVNLLGGTRPHIGAVAVAIPRASLARAGRRSATTSVFTLVGHKDDELARPLATALARELGVTVVVTAGVHLAQARPSDIVAVLRNARRVASAIRVAVVGARTHKRRST